MKYLPIFRCSALLMLSSTAFAADGVIAHKSPYSVEKTIDRFAENAKAKGLKVFDRVDHAAGAKTVDMTLRPTQLLIFGHPKGGTPLMQCAQTIGLDLPMKALAWKDAEGQVWLGYNDPAYIAQRHGAADCAAVEPVSRALAGLAKKTVSR